MLANVATGAASYYSSLGLTYSPTGTSQLQIAGNIMPLTDNLYNMGSTGFRWANIYTGDLQLSNEGSPIGNEVDNTTGSWTIQEGEDNLFILNRKTGKRYMFVLKEV